MSTTFTTKIDFFKYPRQGILLWYRDCRIHKSSMIDPEEYVRMNYCVDLFFRPYLDWLDGIL